MKLIASRNEPKVNGFASASRFRLQTFSKIREAGEARVRAVMRCLAEGEPVICGLQVGEKFDKYRAGSKPLLSRRKRRRFSSAA